MVKPSWLSEFLFQRTKYIVKVFRIFLRAAPKDPEKPAALVGLPGSRPVFFLRSQALTGWDRHQQDCVPVWDSENGYI